MVGRLAMEGGSFGEARGLCPVEFVLLASSPGGLAGERRPLAHEVAKPAQAGCASGEPGALSCPLVSLVQVSPGSPRRLKALFWNGFSASPRCPSSMSALSIVPGDGLSTTRCMNRVASKRSTMAVETDCGASSSTAASGLALPIVPGCCRARTRAHLGHELGDLKGLGQGVSAGHDVYHYRQFVHSCLK